MHGQSPPVAAPPDPLLTRVGVDENVFPTRPEREHVFREHGLARFRDIASVSPPPPLTVLDFGCGSGRILQWWLEQRPADTIAGCDIHEPTIEWMREHYPPEVRLYANHERPPLPEPDERFDLIYCGSVFSHLTDWAPWLLELLRILKPGGTLVASVHGSGTWPLGLAASRGEPWDEDATGLLVEYAGESFHSSWGPAVYASEWWLRAHWGAAMDIISYHPAGFGHGDNRTNGQAWVVGSRRPGPLPTAEAIDALSDDPREVPSLARALRLAHEEIGQHHIPEVRRLWHDLQESAKAWNALAEARSELERLRGAREAGLLRRLAQR
jgi:SAM-dependent methyltransferase